MPDLPFCCIVNPTAGRGRTARLWPEIERVMRRAGLRFRTFFTEGRGHARELAQRAVKKDCDLVVAVGGDGTVNEVVNGIASNGAYPGTALALLPTGSGNDLCRTLGISGDPLSTALAICSGKYRMLDLGMVENRYFLNICGVGFDAEVAHAVNQGFRWLRGTWAYLAGVLKTLMCFRPVPLELTLDGNHLQIKGLLVAVANGAFFGSGIKIAPRARVDDGLFDVCVVGDIGRLELLRVLPLTYSGRHEDHPCVHFFRARDVTVSSPARRLYIQGDGELLGETPAAFHIHKQAIRVLVPDKGAGLEFSKKAG
ncbi:MAG TPA: diacylglycerol kinase family lipid kinase [Syntrophomonadaceae bacterium]|nr:diacylglycerol kinase family lipid kinase [Syntrophomonadaceae bacterium]